VRPDHDRIHRARAARRHVDLVDDFERRLTLAHRATSVSEIARTVSDLTEAAPSTALAPAAATPPVLASERPYDRVVAVFGGVERRGAWVLPRHLEVRAVLGGVLLDFRQAALLPGVTDVHVVAVMGGAQIIVPPGLSVDVSGTAVLGGFGHVERVPAAIDPDRPVLRVHGLAVLGGVAVETRLAGETETDAHRRRHGPRAIGGRNEPPLLTEKTRR